MPPAADRGGGGRRPAASPRTSSSAAAPGLAMPMAMPMPTAPTSSSASSVSASSVSAFSGLPTGAAAVSEAAIAASLTSSTSSSSSSASSSSASSSSASSSSASATAPVPGSEDYDYEREVLSRSFPRNIIPKLHNVVGCFNLRARLDLLKIAMRARNAEFQPKRFNAVIMRMQEPKTTALVFQSGKVVVTGAKNEKDLRLAARKFAFVVQKVGFPEIQFEEFVITNVVASCSLGFPVRLEGLASEHTELSCYEPELFPGLIYRMVSPKVVALIFVSGNVVLTGAKSRADIYDAFIKIYPIIEKFKKKNFSATAPVELKKSTRAARARPKNKKQAAAVAAAEGRPQPRLAGIKRKQPSASSKVKQQPVGRRRGQASSSGRGGLSDDEDDDGDDDDHGARLPASSIRAGLSDDDEDDDSENQPIGRGRIGPTAAATAAARRKSAKAVAASEDDDDFVDEAEDEEPPKQEPMVSRSGRTIKRRKL